MASTLSIIGYGEAGRTFASAAGWGAGAQVFDIQSLGVAFREDGVTGCADLPSALSGSACILSLVTADQSLTVAEASATSIANGAYFFDMNSVAPRTKREAARCITGGGGRYVDVAIMAPVKPARLEVPLLVAGPHALGATAILRGLGFANVSVAGDEVGIASTIKMLRSVMYKGMEALTAECLSACASAGVTEAVISSLGEDWGQGADYRLDRMLVHGERRAAEMREAEKTLADLGFSAKMTRGTIEHQSRIGAIGQGKAPSGLDAKLRMISQ